MSNRARSIRLDGDQERIRQWRLERQKIAEIERQKRLSEKEREKDQARQAENAAAAQAAATLAPSEADIHAVEKEQRHASRRQRRNFALQFCFSVVLPMVALGYYLFWVATPLYESRTIVRFEDFNSLSEQASLRPMRGPSPSNIGLAFAADAFIKSQAMADKLEAAHGSITYLSSNAFDPFQRTWPDQWFMPTQEQQIQKFFDSYVDVQTGFLTLRVKMDQPDRAQDISETILATIQDRVTTGGKLRSGDAVASATLGLTAAEEELRDARSRLVSLQSDYGMVDPVARFDRLTRSIAALEAEVSTLDLDIHRAKIAGRDARVQTQQSIELRDALLQQIQSEQNGLVSGEPSLTEISALFQNALLDIDLAERRLDSAYSLMSDANAARRVSSQQVAVVVPTQTTDYAVYPKKLSTLLSALVVLVAVFFFARLTIFRPSPNFV